MTADASVGVANGNAVPEPASLFLLIIALLAAGLVALVRAGTAARSRQLA